MTDPTLHSLLEKLHEELQHIDSMDEKGRDLLRGLDAEIRALLDRSGEQAEDASLAQNLQTALDHFEITHPRLTMAISEMLNALNNAGI